MIIYLTMMSHFLNMFKINRLYARMKLDFAVKKYNKEKRKNMVIITKEVNRFDT